MTLFFKKRPLVTAFLFSSLVLAFFVVFIYSSSTVDNHGMPLSLGTKVAIIEINGPIVESKEIIEEIQSARKNNGVKAVVLRVNSPGGGVAPAQEIYSEIKELGGVKKVVASLSSVAASGGYYIACAADKVVANPGTMTGSIGVVINFSNTEELFKKVGYKSYVLKSGKYKDIGSPAREMTIEEKSLLQGVIDNVHGQFVDAVATGRGMPHDEVMKISDGRIFSGEQALSLGLVDMLGSLQDSIRLAADMAGIKGEPKVHYMDKKEGLLDYIFGGLPKSFSNFFNVPQFMYMMAL